MISTRLAQFKCIKHIKLRVILGVLFVFGQTLAAEKRISADWAETLLKSSGNSRIYAGKVVFVDALQALTVRADSAFVNGDKYVFIDNLHFKDSTRTIQAKKMVYDDISRVAHFEGQVRLEDGVFLLRGENVRVLPQAQEITVLGRGSVAVKTEPRKISANKIEYFKRQEEGRAVGQVFLDMVNFDDSLSIQTDSLTFAPKQGNYVFWGDTLIDQGDMALKAQFGEYTDDQLELAGNPRVVWTQDEEADSVLAQADTMRVLFEKGAIDSLFLKSNVNLLLTELLDSLTTEYTIHGHNAIVNVVDGGIANLQVFGSGSVGFKNTKTHVDVQGDSVSVWLSDGQIDSIAVVGESDGYFHHVGKGQGEFGGSKKKLGFVDGKLSRMIVMVGAYCRYTSLEKTKGNNVNVAGEVLELLFEDDDLGQIKAIGQVAGVYLQTEAVQQK